MFNISANLVVAKLPIMFFQALIKHCSVYATSFRQMMAGNNKQPGDQKKAKYEICLLAFMISFNGIANETDGEGPIQSKTKLSLQRDIYPDWSPDGKKLAFHSNRAGNIYQVFIMDINTQDVFQLTFDAIQKRNATWSEDGNKIIYTGGMANEREIYLIDVYTRQTTRLTFNDVPDYHPTWIKGQNRIMFDREVSPKNTDLFTMDLAIDDHGIISNSSEQQITDYSERDSFGSVSPDGTKIVWRRVFAEEGKALNADIVVADIDGKNLKRLTNNSSFDSYPHWMKDSNRIMFSSNREGEHYEDFNIFVINIDGSGLKQLTQTIPEVEQIRARLSPDGTQVVYNLQYLDGTISLHLADL
jgi:Tol biopolymer transport system component